MPTLYEKVYLFSLELDRLRNLLAEVESYEDSDVYIEENGPGDVSEGNFSDHEDFSEHDNESEEDERHLFSLISDYANKRMDDPCLAHELRIEVEKKLLSAVEEPPKKK
ncbi:hypothetical protein AVEN_128783-1 [Araneus ventricosus]|uniref:Uncharacterized protein n=1 Tax=Araneus ventricosus TaxID=182803 RepID=A0A4Y2RM56_ARAVE|nr:hypothetical protein AVEN_128783-1 [Araneus ventricosus]